jgi:hypothetical protein
MPEENTGQTKEKVTVITSAVAREKYPVRKGYKTANGGAVRDSGDEVAVALRGKGIEHWLALADANGRGDDLRKTAEAHPNNLGMVRMALGTILRAAIKRHNESPDTVPYPILELGGEGQQQSPTQPNDGDDDDGEVDEIEDDEEVEDDSETPESGNAV